MKPQLKNLNKIALWASILGVLAFLLEFGFTISDAERQMIDGGYCVIASIGLIATFVRYYDNPQLFRNRVAVFDGLSILYTLYVFYQYLVADGMHSLGLFLAVVLSFIRQSSEFKIKFNRAYLNAFQLFILSFIVIIFLGAFLLMLPRATHQSISFIDALFTSTSAVCVTGLAVMDTGSDFTTFGQMIILFLIQTGGLGILTFVSYFGYFFKGGSTYEDQLILSEITQSSKLGDVFNTLKNIILITITVELISAILIFFSLEGEFYDNFSEKLLFSVFHSVSAFCNAGFSTQSQSIYEPVIRYNYPLQLVLIITFLLGGLGFPIVSNILKYIKHKILNLFKPKKVAHRPWVLNINSRITLITTTILILIPWVIFFFLEYHHTLGEHHFLGKVMHSLFSITTPRTAGFNSVNMSALTLPSIVLILFLMWIGASPASVGGGIKTSTFAIAILNIISLARGKSRIEIYRREISNTSVRRAFATIFLSIVVIGLGIILMSIFDAEKGLLNLSFECVSAYSTVGLSLGITSDLSDYSKMILIVVMFVGRVSMLSLVTAVFKKVRYKNYRYPSEEITIN